ncbi:LrgB family protein [Telmatospirillum siberiense]|uniref:Murein hydrolase effector protein LrgB n=1 Tax=Telmatospirillum siberiense TaxID=382514 RepID=A0A2N3PVE7_9PROT|nr:LrgB family protein [Telmatospirillum siberiense]PKU24367.1 murein hydrolase effector protein LrgB [Telmatospirillum siberiense]
MPAELHGLLWAVFWAVATLVIYVVSHYTHRRLGRWWTSPLLVTWLACFALTLSLHATYGEYIRGTHWLVSLLGPATVAFAMPIYEQRDLIRRHWPILAIGIVAGTVIAIGSSWALASALDLSPSLRLSLLPRSISTPFALAFAEDVGGVPELAATCVVITGLIGASLGELVMKWLPLRSSFARGALFGMGAHGAGTARARQVGAEEGSIAGLVMVLAGLASVLVAPILAYCLKSSGV